jgi:hypothetical protein
MFDIFKFPHFQSREFLRGLAIFELVGIPIDEHQPPRIGAPHEIHRGFYEFRHFKPPLFEELNGRLNEVGTLLKFSGLGSHFANCAS